MCKSNLFFYISMIVSLLWYQSGFATEPISDNANPTSQFISHWKPQVIAAADDERVALAERVFQRLLRAWDSPRLEPGLFVVQSSRGPWAASLVDGNILLSSRALDTCLNFGPQRAEHLLAFILAHELAHQRADDLWQHRFFRDGQIPQDSPMDSQSLVALEQKEAKADYDGLILMSSVGFNPYQIVDRKDFFTEWVESIWHSPCNAMSKLQSPAQKDRALDDACTQAKERALRSRSQLNTVASQSSLYELGVKALVANNFERAQHYFTQYARDFPSRAVLSALGISFLAEAIGIQKDLISQGLLDSVDFYYPLILDAHARLKNPPNTADASSKRAASDQQIKSQQQKIQQLSARAVEYLEKAIKLQPDYRNSYILLANAYLTAGNHFMVRGVIQGRYHPRFGNDRAGSMLLAMTRFLEGEASQALNDMAQLIDNPEITSNNSSTALPPDIINYSLSYNLAALQIYSGAHNESRRTWQALAKKAQSTSNAYLFSLAVVQLQPLSSPKNEAFTRQPTINGLRLGDLKTRDDASHSINELWIEGEPFHVYNYDKGVQFITAIDGRIISAEQQSGPASLGQKLHLGDDASRILKTMGLPDRRIHLISGDYLAYDRYGLGLQVENEVITAWFLL